MLIPLHQLSGQIDFLFSETIWPDLQKPINALDVHRAFQRRQWAATPFQTDDCHGYHFHARRIAYFMAHPEQIGSILIENQSHELCWLVVDGKHRLMAAHLLGIDHIEIRERDAGDGYFHNSPVPVFCPMSPSLFFSDYPD